MILSVFISKQYDNILKDKNPAAAHSMRSHLVGFLRIMAKLYIARNCIPKLTFEIKP